MLRLHFRTGTQIPVYLNKPVMILGSAAGADIALPAGFPAEVALIETQGDQSVLRLMATGTEAYVNGQAVPAQGQALQAGDLIRLDTLEIEVNDPLASVQAMKDSVEKLTGAPLEAKPKASQVASHSPWKLVGQGGLLDSREYPLAGTVVLGRDTEADIVIPSTHLSRKHVELEVKAGAIRFKDLNSVNGTFVNGKRASEGYLKNGDELRIDTFHFVIAGPAQDRDKTTVADAINIPSPVRNPDDIRWKTKPTSVGNNYKTGVTDKIDATPASAGKLPLLVAGIAIAAIAVAGLLLFR